MLIWSIGNLCHTFSDIMMDRENRSSCVIENHNISVLLVLLLNNHSKLRLAAIFTLKE